jgi:hypothetical protein
VGGLDANIGLVGFENKVDDDDVVGGNGREDGTEDGGEPNMSIALSAAFEIDEDADDVNEDGNDGFAENKVGVDENVGREFGTRNALWLLPLLDGAVDFCSSSFGPSLRGPENEGRADNEDANDDDDEEAGLARGT